MRQSLFQPFSTSETHILKMLSRRAPMMDVLKEVCNLIDSSSPDVISAVLLLDDDGLHLRLAAGPRVPEAWNDSLNRLEPHRPPRSEQTSQGDDRSAALTDLQTDPTFASCWSLARVHNVRAAWSVPIASEHRGTLGSLIFFCPTPSPPCIRDLDLIEHAIHMAAITIECHQNEEELREFSRRLYQSQDEERRRIARELHDSTGQKLAVLEINLSRAKARSSAPPIELDDVLLQCVSLTRNIADDLRTLSYLLHPPMLDECGLNTAIQWYVSGINQRNGLHVEVETTQELCRLSDEAELAIFRIVQASLTNVHLHSKAKKAKVRVEQRVDGIFVAVSDDGQGIPVGVLTRSSQTEGLGIGITGMRERVKLLGGHLEIETSCNGTRVEATIPSRHFRSVTADAVAHVAY